MRPLLDEPVVPRWESRGLPAIALATGLISGSTLAWATSWFGFWPVLMTNRWFSFGLPPTLLVAGPVIYAVLAARVTRQRFVASFFASLAAMAFMVAAFAGDVLNTPGWDWDLGSSTWDWATSAGVVLIVACVCTWMLVYVVALVLRAVVGPIEQTADDALCRRCAYVLEPAMRVCPECGADRATARYRARHVIALERTLRQSGRALLFMTVVVLTGWVAHRFVIDYLPGRAFLRRFDSGGNACQAYIDHRPSGFMGTYRFEGSMGRRLGVRVPDAGGGADGEVVVAYRPRAAAGAPVMQVQVGAVTSFGGVAGSRPYTQLGSPVITASFTREQAQEVIERGLPAGLVEALVAAATVNQWSVAGTTSPGQPAEVRIDPEPYLARERNRQTR